MIDTMPYAIGFLIYVGFCLVTFNVYSQKKELTKIFVLIFIYLYYTALAGYLIIESIYYFRKIKDDSRD